MSTRHPMSTREFCGRTLGRQAVPDKGGGAFPPAGNRRRAVPGMGGGDFHLQERGGGIREGAILSHLEAGCEKLGCGQGIRPRRRYAGGWQTGASPAGLGPAASACRVAAPPLCAAALPSCAAALPFWPSIQRSFRC